MLSPASAEACAGCRAGSCSRDGADKGIAPRKASTRLDAISARPRGCVLPLLAGMIACSQYRMICASPRSAYSISPQDNEAALWVIAGILQTRELCRSCIITWMADVDTVILCSQPSCPSPLPTDVSWKLPNLAQSKRAGQPISKGLASPRHSCPGAQRCCCSWVSPVLALGPAALTSARAGHKRPAVLR